MKRHIQKTGVRKFFGQDFVDLQAEPLKALDAFFAEYGACLIEGCAVTEADGGTFSVAPGLVALESTDPDSGVVAVRTMPFAGAKGVALPLYLVAQWTVVERAYGDGKVKPIAYDLAAVASGIVPEGPHLVLTDAGGNRFVDAVQDPAHRFISDAERTKWNAVLQQAKEYAVAQAQAEAAASQATAVGLAKAHTEGQVAAVRNELALGDQAALNTAKAYADRIVAALVDNSPELLNTLEELAAALGGDPNFATTVLQKIGERETPEGAQAKVDKMKVGAVNLANNSKLVSGNTNELGYFYFPPTVYASKTLKKGETYIWAADSYLSAGGHLTLMPTEQVVYAGQPFRPTVDVTQIVGHSGVNLPYLLSGFRILKGHRDLGWLPSQADCDAALAAKETPLGAQAKANAAQAAAENTAQAKVDTMQVGAVNLVANSKLINGATNSLGYYYFPSSIYASGTLKKGETYIWGADAYLSAGSVLTLMPAEQLVYAGTPFTPVVDVTQIVGFSGPGLPYTISGLRIYKGHKDVGWLPKLDNIPTKIIRGAVDADGNLLPGSNGGTCFKNGNFVRLFHNLGHTNFSATATVYSSNPALYDNVVSVATKTSSY